ncbi:hypothetical protein GUG52_10855, partial [Xanthomonas citri pv. citri]|nr:hypothetical protein [Xanthomonas citri pv. citri]
NPTNPVEPPVENPVYSKYLNNESLVSLRNGLMTMQFKNMTKGEWNDDQVYITTVALNSSNRWCYLTPDGNLVPIAANSTSESWSYTLTQLRNG